MTSDGLTERIQYQHAEWVSIHAYFSKRLVLNPDSSSTWGPKILHVLFFQGKRWIVQEIRGPRHRVQSTFAGPEIFQFSWKNCRKTHVSSVKFSTKFDAWVHSFTWDHIQVISGKFSTPMTYEFLGYTFQRMFQISSINMGAFRSTRPTIHPWSDLDWVHSGTCKGGQKNTYVSRVRTIPRNPDVILTTMLRVTSPKFSQAWAYTTKQSRE